MNLKRSSFAIAAAAAYWLVPLPAFAHFGHIGELAGHSHWVGWAALGSAAALAALLGRRPKPQSAEETGDQAVAGAGDATGDEAADGAAEEQSA